MEQLSDVEPLLAVRDVTLRFGGVTALDGVSFDVRPGELFAVIGPNGAGKTSIFNCINGVYRPQDGSIRLAGEELVGRSPPAVARLGVARTFQNLGLFTHLSVIDNLMLGRHHLMRTGFVSGALWWGRARREEIAGREAVESVVELLELEAHRHTPAGLLPYGLQKRLELGRALAMEPRLLLLDEPVAGMNLEEVEDMARYLLEVRERLDARRDPRRARDAVGDGPRRPRTGARLRNAARVRHTGDGAGRAGGRGGVPGGGRVSSLPALLLTHARERPDDVAIRAKRRGRWEEITWARYAERVAGVARGLRELDVRPRRPGRDP